MAQKTHFHPRKCLLGLKKLKLTLNPFLCPKGEIFAKEVDFWLFGRKPLNNGDAQE